MRVLALAVVALLPVSAQAFDWARLLSPWRTPLERWVERIDDARGRGELDLASTLVDAAEHELGASAPFVRQRALIQRDRGHLEDAVKLFAQSADDDPASDARVEQSAALVVLGRWPEAVGVLAQAFDERGPALRGDAILVDARFAPLVGFKPYDELIAEVRAEQSGPLGRVLLKFERIEASARTAESVLGRLAEWMTMFGRLTQFFGSGVVVLLVFGMFLGSAVHQLDLVRPPITMLVGLAVASVVWHLGVRIATADADDGLRTIIVAFGLVIVPWTLVRLGRYGYARWQRSRYADPFAPEHASDTASLLDAATQAARRVVEAPEAEREAALVAARDAVEQLRERLG